MLVSLSLYPYLSLNQNKGKEREKGNMLTSPPHFEQKRGKKEKIRVDLSLSQVLISLSPHFSFLPNQERQRD